jgi:hypothetical protein
MNVAKTKAFLCLQARFNGLEFSKLNDADEYLRTAKTGDRSRSAVLYPSDKDLPLGTSVRAFFTPEHQKYLDNADTVILGDRLHPMYDSAYACSLLFR